MDFENTMTANTSEEAATSVNNAAEQTGNAEPGKQTTEPEAEQETNDMEFEDDGTDGNGGQAQSAEPKEQAKPQKTVQSKERNAEEARKRRAAEQAEAVSKARINAIIEATDGVNPYTGDEIKDEEDVEEYLSMRKIEKDGGDPRADYSRFLKEKIRKEREETQRKADEQRRMRNDIDDFKAAYPDVDIKGLLQNESFSEYAEGKLGNRPLTEIYSRYNSMMNKARTAEQAKAAQALANSRATPGAVATAGNAEDTFFTKEQVQKMSPAEVTKNLDKILESQRKWRKE